MKVLWNETKGQRMLYKQHVRGFDDDSLINYQVLKSAAET